MRGQVLHIQQVFSCALQFDSSSIRQEKKLYQAKIQTIKSILEAHAGKQVCSEVKKGLNLCTEMLKFFQQQIPIRRYEKERLEASEKIVKELRKSQEEANKTIVFLKCQIDFDKTHQVFELLKEIKNSLIQDARRLRQDLIANEVKLRQFMNNQSSIKVYIQMKDAMHTLFDDIKENSAKLREKLSHFSEFQPIRSLCYQIRQQFVYLFDEFCKANQQLKQNFNFCNSYMTEFFKQQCHCLKDLLQQNYLKFKLYSGSYESIEETGQIQHILQRK